MRVARAAAGCGATAPHPAATTAMRSLTMAKRIKAVGFGAWYSQRLVRPRRQESMRFRDLAIRNYNRSSEFHTRAAKRTEHLYHDSLLLLLRQSTSRESIHA